MGRYRLIFRKSVAKDLRDIPNQDVARILARIDALPAAPRMPGCEKLSGREQYRVRQGAYRILYEVSDEKSTIIVVKVGHRRDVYRDG